MFVILNNYIYSKHYSTQHYFTSLPKATLQHPNRLLNNHPRLGMPPVVAVLRFSGGVAHWHHEMGLKGIPTVTCNNMIQNKISYCFVM